MPTPTIGSGFSDYIGVRQRPGQAAEYYNKQNATQAGFANPRELATFANTLSQRSDITTDNVFDVLAQGFTPRSQALQQIGSQLNDYQQQIFDQEEAPARRASSSITENIDNSRAQLDQYLTEYSDLRKKLEGLGAPNFQAEYNTLREKQGVPALEQDFLNLGKQRRELPYLERARTGNAAVTTESQLAAQTSEKDVPLYIQQTNALDRLKLAQDFLNNSLRLKELDYNASRQSLGDAINLLGNTINFSRQELQDLYAQQDKDLARQAEARKFAFENRIGKPFYDIGGTVYRTADGKPASDPEEYVRMGGVGDFSDVQKVEAPKFNRENLIGNDALGYFHIDPVTGEKTKILEGTGNIDFTKIGVDENGNDLYGFVNKGSGTVTPATGTPTAGSGASLGTPVGDISGLPSYNTLAANPGMTRSDRNNNPGNIKLSNFTKGFEGVVGVEATAAQDGGNFLIFNTPQDGFNAMARLLTEGKSYQGVSAQTAIKKWNGNGGYGAADVGLNPNQDFQSQIRDPQKLQEVVQKMARLEGYKGTTASGGPETTTLTNALKSLAPRLTAAAAKSAQATLNGYIKSGDLEGAKQFIISTAISSLPVEQQNKAFGRLQSIDALTNIENLLAQYKARGGNTNILSGTQEQIEQKLGQTSNPELAAIGSQITLAMVAYRQSVSGAAFTESEAKIYEQLFPSTKNIGTLNEAKIKALKQAFNLNQKTVLQTVIGARTYDELTQTVTQSPYDKYAGEVGKLSPEDQYASSITSQFAPAPQPKANTQAVKEVATSTLRGAAQANPIFAPFTPVVNLIKRFFK
jgi:hypothetical protein